MTQVFKDKTFLKNLWVLALPITIQTFITSSLSLMDNIMVGRLGEQAIAAVGQANQFIFIFTLAILGVNAGASIFMSQYWGKEDLSSIKKVLGLDVMIGLIVAMLFAGFAFIKPEWIMNILSRDQEVIKLGSGYLQIVAISCVFVSITQAYSAALRSTEQVKVPMRASMIGVGSNVVLNAIFIFGLLGVPAMGVYGAALGTTLARLIEVVYIVGSVYITKNKIAANLKELFSFDLKFVITYFKTSWSVIVNELIFSIGMTAYTVAYARIGTDAVATMQITNTLNNMFTVLLVGMAVAVSIMIGNSIGAEKVDEAKVYAKNIGILTPLVSVIIAIGIWLSAPYVVGLFDVSPNTHETTIQVLRILAVFFPIRAFNMVMIVGVFRGGGDTLYSMVVQGITIWLYSVPLAFLGASVLGLSVQAVFLLVCTEEFVKIFFEFTRLKSGKWIKRVI